MKVAVTTPTGNIGRVVTDKLLDAGADVTLLVRDPGKVRAFTERGAETEAGSLDDGEYVKKATAGAECLFWVTPPNYAATASPASCTSPAWAPTWTPARVPSWASVTWRRCWPRPERT